MAPFLKNFWPEVRHSVEGCVDMKGTLIRGDTVREEGHHAIRTWYLKIMKKLQSRKSSCTWDSQICEHPLGKDPS